jgi:hypothetical protein
MGLLGSGGPEEKSPWKKKIEKESIFFYIISNINRIKNHPSAHTALYILTYTYREALNLRRLTFRSSPNASKSQQHKAPVCCCWAVSVILAFVCHTYIIAIANWIGFLYGERNREQKTMAPPAFLLGLYFLGYYSFAADAVWGYCTDDFPGHFLFLFAI